MIGVIAPPSEHLAICEFFELFKTPWEPYRAGKKYDVLLCAGDVNIPSGSARLALVYAGGALPSDAENGVRTAGERDAPGLIRHDGLEIPVYGNSVALGAGDRYVQEHPSNATIRVGYDLFREVRMLLTEGQPAAYAAIPALDRHVALLRDLIVGHGIGLAEIPPAPSGHRFIACLTHDVDHPLLKLHKFDHTMFGFLYRSVIGSVLNVVRGRRSPGDLLKNWSAALKLPLTLMGLAADPWSGFDQYPEIEGGRRSSFFIIPFKGEPGQRNGARAPRKRASAYSAADIAEPIESLTSQGCEIGLHGIDAWRDASRGRDEIAEIRRVAGRRQIGVRMHWLYFDPQSPVKLERAGADYDSTVGYNETIGYRAGTAQVYKPLETSRLLELPLHVMDTALFYPSHLNLTPREAAEHVGPILENAAQSGGCITVNWHDRSIAPERLWGGFYKDLIAEMDRKGAWFASAGEAVAWFRKRRSASFESSASAGAGAVRVKLEDARDDLPGLQLRVHTAKDTYADIELTESAVGAA
jgi:hypothetical protein